MPPKLEVSGKRILFFTKVILTFLVISILIFLNYIDLQESINNRKYLCLLRDVYTASDKEDLNFEEFELERLRWLGRNTPSLQKKHSDSRIALVNLLNAYGANIGGKEKGGGTNPNTIILMSKPHKGVPKKDFANDDDDLSEVVVVGYGSARPERFGTVDMAMDSFLRYHPNDTVYLLTGIDTAALRHQLDSLLTATVAANNAEMPTDSSTGTRGGTRPVDVSGTGGPESVTARASTRSLFRQYWFLQGLELQKDKVYISLRSQKDRDMQSNAQVGVQGSRNSRAELIVPASCDSAIFPSTLHLAKGFDTSAVHELAQNENKRDELLKLYGSFNLDFIDNLSTEAFSKNNNAISILGFDISRKWFPIAMFLVLLGIYIMLFKTIQKAASSSAKIISGYDSDDALDFLIDNKWFRFAIWVLTPAFLLFLVLYSTLIQYNIALYAGMITAGVVSVLLGWLSYARSLKL